MSPHHKTYRQNLQHYATSRETRASAMVANTGNNRRPSEGLVSSSESGSPKQNHKIVHTENSTDRTDSSASDGDVDEDDAEDSSDEPEELAPSELARKRKGHQTGLSVTLTHTSLGGAGKTRKRAYSTTSDEDFETPTPNKARKHQQESSTSVVNSDDDEIYNDVDLISDSEAEEPELELLEERAIIDSEEENSTQPYGHFFDAHMTSDPVQVLTSTPSSASPKAETRRVRFAEDIVSGSDSNDNMSEMDYQVFPNAFLQQDHLDPDFRRMLEEDITDKENVTDSEGSSGYETDDGETTDEEALPPTTINQPQALLRIQPQISNQSRLKSARTARLPAPSALRRRGPPMGSWTLDPTKPSAVTDKTGKKIVFFPARAQPSRPTSATANSNTSSATVSPRNSFAVLANTFDDSEVDQSDYAALGFGYHMLSRPDANMDELFQVLEDEGEVDIDEDDDDDDDEDLWNINDMVDWGDSSDSDQNENADTDAKCLPKMCDHCTSGSGNCVCPFEEAPQPFEQSSPTSALRLMQHLDRGVVSAFRRNQVRHQTLLRAPIVSPSAPRIYGVNGYRQRLANNPISPLRMRKANHKRSNSMLPIGATAAQRAVANHKRKISG